MSDPNLPPPPGEDPNTGGTPAPPPPGGAPPPPGGGTPPPPSGPPPGQPYQSPPPGAGGPPGGFVSQPAGQPYQQNVSGGSGVGDAFQYGWTKFQQNIGQLVIAIAVWIGAFLVAGLIMFLLLSVFGAIGTSTNEFGVTETNSIGGIGLFLVTGLGIILMVAANFIGGAALLRVGLLTTRGESLTPQKLFSTDNLVPYILTSLLVGLIVSIGSILCYVPGIIAAFFLLFAPYYSLDKGTSPLEAIRASVTLVNRNLATTVVLYIGAIIAYTIGFLLCFIGVLVAFPVILIAYAYMYRKLNGEPVAP